MKKGTVIAILVATACALGGCGGGGGGGFGVNTIPPPPPPPPQPPSTPEIVPAAATSQQFAVATADQPLQVRYVAASNSYEIQLPQSQTWTAISLSPTDPNNPVIYTGGGATLWLKPGSFQYSRLFEWAGNGIGGYEAIGSATPSGGVPVSGSATYNGQIFGRTSEYQAALADDFPVDGTIQLLFDFGLGSLSGSISPNLHQGYTLGSLNFRDTVYSSGSTTFSGKFDTSVAGPNSFSGLFTGPAAQELIGSFVFPYQSPIDGKVYQANGAFAGAK